MKYKILHLPTGTYIKCCIFSVEFGSNELALADWYCYNVELAEEYLNQDFYVFDDFVISQKNFHGQIKYRWRKSLGLTANKVSIPVHSVIREHFEIVECDED